VEALLLSPVDFGGRAIGIDDPVFPDAAHFVLGQLLAAVAQAALSRGDFDHQVGGPIEIDIREAVEMERRLETLENQKQELDARRARLEQQFQHDRRAKLRELDSRLEDTLRQYAKTWEQSLEELRTQAAPAKVVARGERKAAGLVREAREEWNAQVLEALGMPGEARQEPPI
jgi:hypothetical protein